LNSHYDLLKHADKVLVVRDGRIVGDGTYEEVILQFPHLQTQSEQMESAERDVIDEHPTAASLTQASIDPDVATSTSKPSSSIAQHPGSDNVSKESKAESDSEAKTLIKDEDRVKGRVTAQTYLAYFDETGFNGIAVVLIIFAVYAGSQGVRTLVDWWQGHWAKNMARDGVDATYSGLWFGIWYLGFIALCSVMTLGRGLLMMESCIRSSKNLHDELFCRVLSAPVNKYFDVTPVGRILNRFSNDLDQMDSILPQQYQSLFQNLSMSVGALVVCAVASVWIGVSYIPILIIFVITGIYFKKTSREIKRLEGITRSPIFSLFSETLSGLHTIRAFKMQDTFVNLSKGAVDENSSFYFMYWAAGRWLAVRLDWLSVVIIFVVSLYIVATKGQLGALLAGLTITYSLMMTSMVQSTVRAVDRTDNSMTSVERLLHFRSIPAEDDGASCTPI
ncbi:Abc transporter c family member 2, partial [Globisporangium polare]